MLTRYLEKETKMTKTILTVVAAGIFTMILSGCAGDNYEPQYNSYDDRSNNEKQIDGAIASEMNSLSDKDIAQLNKLK